MSGFFERMEATGGPAAFHHVDVDEYTEAVLGLAREHIENFGGRSEKDLLKKPKALRDHVWQTLGSPLVAPLAHNAAHEGLESAKNRLDKEAATLEQMRLSDNPFTRKVVPEKESHVERLVANISGHKAEVMSSNTALLPQFRGDHNLG